jgi:hypothetical protein
MKFLIGFVCGLICLHGTHVYHEYERQEQINAELRLKMEKQPCSRLSTHYNLKQWQERTRTGKVCVEA